MKLLLFAASVRKESFNKKLIRIAAQLFKTLPEVEIELAEFSEFDLPLFDGDLHERIGLPENALQFIERLKQVDGLVISSPEYNFSTPGTLKNFIDWISRARPMPFMGKPTLLMSASPSLVGGNRGLWATRVPLECCGACVFPEMFSLASADKAFEDNGQLKEAASLERLKTNLEKFVRYTKQIAVTEK